MTSNSIENTFLLLFLIHYIISDALVYRFFQLTAFCVLCSAYLIAVVISSFLNSTVSSDEVSQRLMPSSCGSVASHTRCPSCPRQTTRRRHCACSLSLLAALRCQKIMTYILYIYNIIYHWNLLVTDQGMTVTSAGSHRANDATTFFSSFYTAVVNTFHELLDWQAPVLRPVYFLPENSPWGIKLVYTLSKLIWSSKSKWRDFLALL